MMAALHRTLMRAWWLKGHTSMATETQRALSERWRAGQAVGHEVKQLECGRQSLRRAWHVCITAGLCQAVDSSAGDQYSSACLECYHLCHGSGGRQPLLCTSS
jgi:hypothetical protein